MRETMIAPGPDAVDLLCVVAVGETRDGKRITYDLRRYRWTPRERIKRAIFAAERGWR